MILFLPSLDKTDYLFFIHHLPADTVKLRWFLVQVNHIETAILKMNPSTTGGYHVIFLSRHPDDNHLCGGLSGMNTRWTMIISLCYSSRMLFKPNRKPNLAKYILWTESVHLTDFSCFIHGPFNFDSRFDVISAKQIVVLRHWEFLLTSCIALGIAPPPHTMSTLTATNRGNEGNNKYCVLTYTLCMQLH